MHKLFVLNDVKAVSLRKFVNDNETHAMPREHFRYGHKILYSSGTTRPHKTIHGEWKLSK